MRKIWAFFCRRSQLIECMILNSEKLEAKQTGMKTVNNK